MSTNQTSDHTMVRPWRHIDRRASRQIMVGDVPVGGDAPITVQSMTNTPTIDIKATIEQVHALEDAGADIVRISCPDEESSLALKHIVPEVSVPIVADIHFHYKRGIEAAENGAACLRINPGNIGSDARVREVIKAAKDNNCSIRVGVNAGSLERDLLEKYGEPCPDAMVESALRHIQILEDNDFFNFKISCKASDVFMSVAAYQQLADACDYPLHVGITEAGGLRSGTIKSAIGMGNLLWAGIGDTIRVSLSADPVEEIKAGFDILKSLGLRHRGVNVISCPSCARQQFDVIKTVETLEERLAHISTPMTLSVIGCVVNGPGEALMTDIGFTGGGKGTHQVYQAGVPAHRLKDQSIVDHLVDLVEAKAAEIDAAQKDADKSKTESPKMRHKYNQLFGHVPWLIYVIAASVAFSLLFVVMKVASTEITPFLFAFLINVVNVIIHGMILLFDRVRGKFKFHRMQVQTFWVAILIGVLISFNDTSATYMFKTGAPISVAMPIFSAGIVFLTALFGVLLMRERLTRKKIMGLVSILIGIVLLNV